MSNKQNEIIFENIDEQIKELELWFNDPTNDCLRARGDKRWIENIKKHEQLVSFIK